MSLNKSFKNLQKVISYIENNLEHVSIDDLITISGYSYFHLHRIFKAHTGENLKKYIKRLQLEKSILQMKINKGNVTQLALDAGFYMSSSFNKAFKGMFHIAPREYKKNLQSMREGYTDIQVQRIEFVEEMEVYALRYIGSCMQLYEGFDRMLAFAHEHNLIEDLSSVYGITYDDPEVTHSIKLRYDVCIESTKKLNLDTDTSIYKKTMFGGKYAVFTNKDTADNLLDTYNSIFAKWFYENEYELRDAPLLHKMAYSKEIKNIDESLIEVYVPIK